MALCSPQAWPRLVLLAALCSPTAAQSQGLAGSAGAAAIQGSLNTVPVPGAQSTLNRVQRNRAAFNALNGSASGDMVPPPEPPPAPATAASAPAAAAAPAVSGARINGRLVPYCSHGALCHGAMLRAVGLR